MEAKRVSSPAELARCLSIRRTVFIEEQGVPEDLELDGHDDDCVHFLVVDGGNDVGTARLTILDGPDGQRGKAQRVAVVQSHRKRGVGAIVMGALEQEARDRGCATVVLSSQVTAIPFYERLGFKAHGDVYDDAGLPHRDMTKKL